MAGFPTIVQSWRSFEQLEAFANDKDDPHVEVWRNYWRRLGKSGRTGIWATHFEQVRSLTPAASATCAIDRPSSITILTNRRRPFTLSAALPCNGIRTSLDWGFATTSLQGGPDDQRAQELQQRNAAAYS